MQRNGNYTHVYNSPIFVRGGTRSARGRGYLWTNAMRRPPVDDLRDFIDPDEGRDTDWDSHLNVPEPFYTEALPCESCGKPVDGERRASWDESLLVGPCCASDVPESIRDPSICMDLYRIHDGLPDSRGTVRRVESSSIGMPGL